MSDAKTIEAIEAAQSTEGAEIEPTEIEFADELIANAQSEFFIAPVDMPAWMGCVIRYIDSTSRIVGRVVSWLLVPIFIAMVYEVIARKFFIAPTAWAYDVSRMLYGALFMLGAAYGLLRGIHIRADFIYRNFNARTQGIIDASLYILLFIPSMLLFIYTSSEYAWEAWDRKEIIDDTAFRPYAWPIRAVMCISVVFLLLQGISETLKSLYAAWRGKWPS